jgi:hypothetical protein
MYRATPRSTMISSAVALAISKKRAISALPVAEAQ